MAKVIKMGKRPPPVKQIPYECGTCHSLIEFERADIKGDQRDGDYVVCPVCNTWVAASVVWPRAAHNARFDR